MIRTDPSMTVFYNAVLSRTSMAFTVLFGSAIDNVVSDAPYELTCAD